MTNDDTNDSNRVFPRTHARTPPKTLGAGHAIAGLLAMTGCWVPDYLISRAEWSDDDEMFAITVWHAEVPRRYGEIVDSDTPTRHTGDQIFIVPADLSEEAWPITPSRNDGSLECLMSGAGYFVEVRGGTRIVSYTLDGDPTVLFDVEEDGDRHELDGAHISTMSPSPDGRQIAWLLRNEETEREHFGLMTPEGKPLTPLVELDATYIHGLRWTVDNQVFLPRSFEPGVPTDALVWDTESRGFLPQSAARCTGPATTCSRVSEDGRFVSSGGSLESPARIHEQGSNSIPVGARPFSCMLDD